MADDLRKEFHQQLEEIREGIMLVAGARVGDHPAGDPGAARR